LVAHAEAQIAARAAACIFWLARAVTLAARLFDWIAAEIATDVGLGTAKRRIVFWPSYATLRRRRFFRAAEFPVVFALASEGALDKDLLAGAARPSNTLLTLAAALGCAAALAGRLASRLGFLLGRSR
jgi:hypothetical protein